MDLSLDLLASLEPTNVELVALQDIDLVAKYMPILVGFMTFSEHTLDLLQESGHYKEYKKLMIQKSKGNDRSDTKMDNVLFNFLLNLNVVTRNIEAFLGYSYTWSVEQLLQLIQKNCILIDRYCNYANSYKNIEAILKVINPNHVFLLEMDLFSNYYQLYTEEMLKYVFTNLDLIRKRLSRDIMLSSLLKYYNIINHYVELKNPYITQNETHILFSIKYKGNIYYGFKYNSSSRLGFIQDNPFGNTHYGWIKSNEHNYKTLLKIVPCK